MLPWSSSCKFRSTFELWQQIHGEKQYHFQSFLWFWNCRWGGTVGLLFTSLLQSPFPYTSFFPTPIHLAFSYHINLSKMQLLAWRASTIWVQSAFFSLISFFPVSLTYIPYVLSLQDHSLLSKPLQRTAFAYKAPSPNIYPFFMTYF